MGSDGTPEQKAALKKSRNGSYTKLIMAVAFVAFFGAIAFVCYMLKLANEGQLIRLAGKGIAKGSPETYSTKLEFAAKYWILPLIWVKFNVMLIVMKRVPSRAVNPLDGYEDIVAPAKNILTNSVEQLLMSIVMQLSLLTYLSNQEVVNFIPLLNILFLLGRVTFWLGYPMFRTFGFMTTSFPTSIGLGVCVHRFYQQMM